MEMFRGAFGGRSSSVECSTTGYIGGEPKSYKRSRELVRYASAPELLQLVDHPDARVRAYAFLALLEKEPLSARKVVADHIADKATFVYHCGCSGRAVSVNRFFLKNARELFSTRDYEDLLHRIDAELSPAERSEQAEMDRFGW